MTDYTPDPSYDPNTPVEASTSTTLPSSILVFDTRNGALTQDYMKCNIQLSCIGGNYNAVGSRVGTPSNPDSIPAIVTYSTIQTTDLCVSNNGSFNLYADSSGTRIYGNLTVDQNIDVRGTVSGITAAMVGLGNVNNTCLLYTSPSPRD